MGIIINEVLSLAKESVAKGMKRFSFDGICFTVEPVTAIEFNIRCKGKDAGIRVYKRSYGIFAEIA
jgi:hypothetical protein